MCKKGVLFSIILTLALTIMLPFSISADQSLPAPFIGVNANIIGTDTYADHITVQSFTLTPSTLTSTITGVIDCQTPSSPSSSNPCDVYALKNSSSASSTSGLKFSWPTFSAAGGNLPVSNKIRWTFEYEFVFDASYVGWFKISYVFNNTTYNRTIYVNGSSVKFSYSEYISISSFDFVTFTVTDFELHRNVESQWNIPNESIISMMGLFQSGFQLYSYNGNDIHVPIFSENPSLYINNTTVSVNQKKCLVILYTNHSVYNVTTFNQWFTYNSNFEISNFKYMQRGLSGWIVQAEFTNTSNAAQNLQLKSISDSGRFTLFYSSLVYDSYPVSTDFALQFGLTNDYLNATTYGTPSSNESASNLDDSSSNMNTQMNNLVGIEDGYNQQFNNSLNQIDFTSPTGNQNLLSSANFVITVFNGLIRNNFLSTLIIIICILIIGKKVIGK